MKPCGNPLTNAIGGRVRCSATGAAAALALLATIAGGVRAGDDWAGLRAPGVARSGGIRLEPPRLMAAARDTSLTCFEGPLSLIINPGCFDSAPVTPCQSHSTHYFLQYFFPDFPAPTRVKRFGFISNDGSTVFPSAGVVLIPTAENRFPTVDELAALQVHSIPTPHDTALVVVDLQAYDLVVGPGTDVVVCLQFPEGGILTAVGVGPGILADEVLPNPECDFFTLDAGQHYWQPAYPTDPPTDPLDWGFEVIFEPSTALQGTTWSALKTLYRTGRIFPYREP